MSHLIFFLIAVFPGLLLTADFWIQIRQRGFVLAYLMYKWTVAMTRSE